MKIARGTLLLVVDGSQMMVLRNDGDTVEPELTVIEERRAESEKNADIMADAPGLGFSSAGFGRDTKSRADPHQEAEDRFVIKAAEAFAGHAADQKGDLIIAAPPAALGVLRRKYDAAVKDRLAGEIAKDFANHPVDEIARLVIAYEPS
ncbi:Host attachment protein [Altererythrobacter luteolus]|uniref:Host attachment protein n=1 Tax=Pontixanthobacter luteolus TaxID=295089 RepID=A0A6I4V8X7_9SPHN|nr:host attachment family protein [Pontixanthobacter luteolus]MXP48272.1 Host attachment protein [Pontixanthobacter luteolus]